MQDIRWKQRFENFERAFKNFLYVLDELKLYQDSIVHKMAIIQAYEIVLELSWKTLKDYLEENWVALEGVSPKNVIKQAFTAKLIEDAEPWIEMLKDRNLTVHTYNEDTANLVVKNIEHDYFIAINQVYLYLKERL